MNLQSTPIRLSLLILVTISVATLNEWRLNSMEQNIVSDHEIPYFPAETSEADGFYYVRVSSRQNIHFPQIFEKMQIAGNGQDWERIIKGLLKQNSPELFEFVEFDPETRYCFVACSNRKTMQKVAKLIHEYCATEDSLVKLLKRIEEKELFVKIE